MRRRIPRWRYTVREKGRVKAGEWMPETRGGESSSAQEAVDGTPFER